MKKEAGDMKNRLSSESKVEQNLLILCRITKEEEQNMLKEKKFFPSSYGEIPSRKNFFPSR
ncbi:MAG: hypothetical protein J5814_03800 [Bacteroidaceae bacterium]|nr:hypothetical protein [Bacteroidaceae bacterium]